MAYNEMEKTLAFSVVRHCSACAVLARRCTCTRQCSTSASPTTPRLRSVERRRWATGYRRSVREYAATRAEGAGGRQRVPPECLERTSQSTPRSTRVGKGERTGKGSERFPTASEALTKYLTEYPTAYPSRQRCARKPAGTRPPSPMRDSEYPDCPLSVSKPSMLATYRRGSGRCARDHHKQTLQTNKQTNERTNKQTNKQTPASAHRGGHHALERQGDGAIPTRQHGTQGSPGVGPRHGANLRYTKTSI
jgi:hypothetical protein